MGTGIAKSEGLALSIATDDQWLFEQHDVRQLAATELGGGERSIPETEEHERIGRLGLEWRVFRHWTGEDTAAAVKSKPPTAWDFLGCLYEVLYPRGGF